MQAPTIKKVFKELITHKHKRVDNYYWLNERDNPNVIAYLNSENSYRKEQMKDSEKVEEELFAEITEKIVKDDASVPYGLNGYWYYTRYEEGKDYPIYCRKKESLASEEIVLLDVNLMSEGFAYYAIGGMSVSPDNKMLVFGVDNISRRVYTLYFKNLETDEIASYTIEGTTGSAVWANDSKTLFYTQVEQETLRSFKVFRYELGVHKEIEVYHEEDDTFGLYVSKSKSDTYLIIGSYSTLSTENRLLLADDPKGEFKVFTPRERDLEYHIEHYEETFYILTNWEAKNFRLMETSIKQTQKGNWRSLIDHREDVLLDDFEVFKNYLVLEEKRNGLSEICILNHQSKEVNYIDFGEDVYAAGLNTNLEFETDNLRFSYGSLTTPDSIVEYHMDSKEKQVLKESNVLGDFNREDYQTERLWATAKDGVKIPISLVYKKGLKKDGSNPLLQYGYGSYGYGMEPTFSVARLSLLDRGFVYAIAHVRGGDELGRAWYEGGKLLTKRNTFTDFIACSEFLIEEGFTCKEKLFAQGGSAGGMLMGGIVNMRPDLYKGVVAEVPFVDVVTTMLDDTIPLTTGEYDEWGNPNKKEYYDYMLSYSPYDNVEKKDYPNMLVTTGLHDSQVQYWEPAKWVAKLREYKTDENLLLLDINMETGHGGASGRFEAYKKVAMVYAFLLMLVKV